MTDNSEPVREPATSETPNAGDGQAGPPAGGSGNVHRIITVNLLSDLAPAKAYLDRIGAKARNPWSASIVEARKGYDFERASIKLKRSKPDGDFDRIAIYPREKRGAFKPTEKEAAEIFAAAKKVRWPELGYLTALPETMPEDIENALSDHRFLFRDPRRDNRFSYVQTYHPGVEGRGKYGSWIHLTTGSWVFGQPDRLPLYGAEELNGEAFRVFIHEGPKAAHIVRHRLKHSTRDHPWLAELAGAVHIGWPGGGNAHDRVDWQQLDLLPRDTEFIVAEDRDDTGQKAATAIAERHLHALGFTNVLVLRFPESYADGYDLGEEWPEDPPTLRSMMAPSRYVGDAAALETDSSVREVAARLWREGLAFHFGSSACIVPLEVLETRSAKGAPELLRAVAEKVSRWQAWDARAEEMADKRLPPWVLQQLALHPYLLPPLEGVINHPVLSGGRLLSRHVGYDKESKLYISGPEVEITRFATPAEALRFLTVDWLGRFPFATPGDLFRALLIPLTLLLRKTEVRGGAPLAFITAPGAQTGKSLLARTLCLAVLGRLPTPQTYSGNDEEFKKAFFSALMASPSVIYYDNMPNGWSIGSRELDAYTTADEYADRILGKTEQVTVSALSFLLFAGNNIEPKDDTRTRTIEIRLERTEEDENPDMKEALTFTAANRGAILGALEAIAGSAPLEGSSVTRFPDWERIVARPLMGLTGEEGKDLLRATATAKDSARSVDDRVIELINALYAFQKKFKLVEGRGLRVSLILSDAACKSALLRFTPGESEMKPNSAGKYLRKARGISESVKGAKIRMATVRDTKKGRDVEEFWVDGEPVLDDDDDKPPM